jgi:cobalt-zinc-cadmium efflux system protein
VQQPVRSVAYRDRGGLLVATLLSLAIFLIELVAGFAGNSAALLADAGHTFADLSGLALAGAAIWLANRGSAGRRSFGTYRVEILAATLNAVLLLAIAGGVIWQGITRLVQPAAVESGLMVGAALIALALDLVALRVLRAGQGRSLTIRAAYLEVLGDALGSGIVLVAGLIVATTNVRAADGIAAILIGALILPRTWRLLRDSIDVLLEATPKGVDLDEVRRHILEAPGVTAVHDLHAWTITSGMNVVSAHVVMRDDADTGRLIDHLSDCLADDFDIDHSTFQLETREHVLWEGRAARARH